MTIGAAIVLIAVGAVLKWAVTAHVSGFDIQTAGTILLVVGLLGLVLKSVLSQGVRLDGAWAVWHRPGG